MKITKIYISSFGKLNDFTFNFDQNLNTIFQENGFGKTTLSVFIKAMFYSLPSTTKKQLSENERKKYLPWNGGNYGGYIEFNFNKKSYRLIRYFLNKESNDTFELVDLQTGLESKDFSSNIGEEIFGIDSNSFEHILFLPQKQIDETISNNIISRLNNIISGKEVDYDLTLAFKQLETIKKELKNRNGDGKIKNLEQQIEDKIFTLQEYKSQINKINEIKNQIEIIDNEIKTNKQEKINISNKIDLYNNCIEKRTQLNLLNEKQKNLSALSQEFQNIQKFFGNSKIDNNIINEKKEEITKLQSLEINYNQKQSQLQNLNNEKQNLNEEDFKNLNFVHLKNQVDEYTKVKNQIELQESLTKPTNKKLSHNITLILLILASLILVSGAIIIVFSLIVAISLFAASVVLFLISGFLYLINLINQKTLVLAINNLKPLIENKEKLESELISTFAKFSLNSLDFQLNQLELLQKQTSLIKINENIDNVNLEIEQVNLELSKIKLTLNNFFNNFIFEENSDYFNKLNIISNKLNEMNKLANTIKNQNLKILNLQKNLVLTDSEKEILNINFTDLKIKDNEIQSKIENLLSNKSLLTQNLDLCLSKTNLVEEIKIDIEQLTLKKQNYEHQLFITMQTMNFLEKAKQNINTKFFEPIKESFLKYMNKFTNPELLKVNFNSNFEISFENNGVFRKIEEFSSAYQDIIEICLRFALMDLIFKNENFFIILDDPFVNLDQQNFNIVKDFISKISNDRQVIYFTCHNSRTIN